MASQTMNLQVKGLHTYASSISGVPQGALSVADEVSISRLNLIEPRRGFNILEHSLPSGLDRGKKFFFHDGELLIHYGNTLGIYDGSGGVLTRGTLVKPTHAQSVRSKGMNESLYLTSSTGLQKMDDTAQNIYPAGIPRGLMMEQSGSLVTSGTAIDINYGTVAYRYVIARKDAKNKTYYGGVSSRLIVFNNSTDQVNVPIKVFLPDGLDTTYYVEVYRTAAIAGTSGNPATPSDEMQKCFEQLLDSTIITNGYFTFTDIQPDTLLGASLYTSPSQGGISSDNSVPPIANDIEEYKNYLFFADTLNKHKYSFTLIACGGSGLVVNDTITISDGTTTEVYTAKAAEDIGSKHFLVDVASPSLSVRIDSTIRSLANVINQGSSLIYAYLLSTGTASDLPGKIMIEERSLGGASFTAVSSKQAAFSPNLKSTADRNQTSTNDEYRHGLMFSKNGQPEAVPSKNVFFVGSAEDRIKRIIALQDSLFIFKENDGIFVLNGENESTFSIRPLDLSAKILSADSIVTLNNLVYGLFNGGVGAVSESGIEYISDPIKDKFQYLQANALDEIKNYAFGISYEDDGKYILALPSVDGETYSTQQFIYDVFGETWVRWTMNLITGDVNPTDNLLYLSPALSNEIRYERKSYDSTDFADVAGTRTISAVSDLWLTLDDADECEVGDVLEQGDNLAYIEEVDPINSRVLVDNAQDWVTSTADVTHLKAIRTSIQWNNEFADNPAGQKFFSETNIIFRQPYQGKAIVYFFSDINPAEDSIEVINDSGNGAWGEFAWGEIPWGGETVSSPIRLGVPSGHRRCNLLTIRFENAVAFSNFQLNGISLTFNPIGTRTTRGASANG